VRLCVSCKRDSANDFVDSKTEDYHIADNHTYTTRTTAIITTHTTVPPRPTLTPPSCSRPYSIDPPAVLDPPTSLPTSSNIPSSPTPSYQPPSAYASSPQSPPHPANPTVPSAAPVRRTLNPIRHTQRPTTNPSIPLQVSLQYRCTSEARGAHSEVYARNTASAPFFSRC